MLTLDDAVVIPDHVLFSVVGQDAFLLDTRNNRYYALEQVGARFWVLLSQGQNPRACFRALLAEYDVEASRLEADLLELLDDLVRNGLVQITGE